MNKTKEMLQILFPKTGNLEEISNIINTYKDSFGLNTPLRLSQFLAQVREEVGEDFTVKRENLNYTAEALSKIFSAFKDRNLANKYGRINGQKANQEAIANIAYANKLGNGDVNSGDGWTFRGAGCLQITGKSNFEEVIKRIKKYAPNGSTNPDTLEGFILFGMAFWIRFDVYKQADTGNPDKVTEVINRYTHSYEKRKEYFNKIKHLI